MDEEHNFQDLDFIFILFLHGILCLCSLRKLSDTRSNNHKVRAWTLTCKDFIGFIF